eukprot:972413-Rhodomonas_salina.2
MLGIVVRKKDSVVNIKRFSVKDPRPQPSRASAKTLATPFIHDTPHPTPYSLNQPWRRRKTMCCTQAKLDPRPQTLGSQP